MTPGGALALLMPAWAPRLSAAGRAAWTWRHRCLALEQTLNELTDRLARTEIALCREEQASQQAQLRLAEAEDALIRVQSTLDRFRQSRAEASQTTP